MRSSLAALLFVTLFSAACGPARPPAAVHLQGGDPGRGKSAIERHGCGGCHTIPGVTRADGLVGPPLNRIAERVYIAGVLENNPENMRRWLTDPPGIDPKTAMPKLGLSDQDVADIASYLYTLR